MSKTITTLNTMALNGELAANIGTVITDRNDRAALAIAASWTDFSIRAARAERHQVLVTSLDDEEGEGEEYTSVAKAFAALDLPMSKHIKVRMTMVREGTAEFEGYRFDQA